MILENEIIKTLENTEALLNGHFELRSGLHSGQFFQCANMLRFPDVAEKLSKALVEKMKTSMGSEFSPDAVISPALGGILVGHEVARALGVMSIFAEKENNRLVMRRFKIEEGAQYVVAEDVITRGGRVQETIDIVENAGGKVLAVALFVDRSGGNAEFNCPVFSLLKMEPVVWEPDMCPLCKKGMSIEHPGS